MNESNLLADRPLATAATTATTPTGSFPTWIFTIPVDVANLGFQIAVYGQDPNSQAWMYWDATTTAYVNFASSDNGQDATPLINATPSVGTYTKEVSFAVTLASSQSLQSGVVAMFIGSTTGIPVASGIPASPTTGTNPNDLYSLFEFTYTAQSTSVTPSLDIDISNVDQVGFTYTVTSSSAPFPLSEVGSSLSQHTVFSRFGTAFPAGHAFNECLLYGQSGGKQLRLLAPQDVLQAISPPLAPSYLNPTGAPATTEPFANNTYFYLVSESSATGETMPCAAGVFGGYLLNSSGQPQAAGIDIGWQSGGTPIAYTPMNLTATSLNLYRAAGPATDAASPPPVTPSTGYTLLTNTTIKAWNTQPGLVYFDDSTSTSVQTPPTSSYGFSALSTWFDQPLKDFFACYSSVLFTLYQSNQNNGANGTLWMGSVAEVTPQAGKPITTFSYIDENGGLQSINTSWQWGDGTQTYLVLQLVGSAYDPTDLTNTSLKGQSGLTQGEYQGAVLNIYFPYFTGNTGLTTIALPSTSIDLPGVTYPLPSAPAWMNNASYGPSQMVFGCAGTFATPNDPDALAQDASYAVLAKNALTNIQNVIVSALNRGIATGYGLALQPQQYTCLYGLSQAPTAAAQTGTIPAGTYTYYLSGTLNNGAETAISWGQTITLPAASAVTLNWLPQPACLYQQVNIYRQMGAGAIQLVGTVSNTTASLATTFTDQNQPVTQPSNGAPFAFYPAWSNSADPSYAPSNLFSAFLHQNLSADPTAGISLNGLVYGYPFDDQGNFSTNINYGANIPSSISFQISTLS